MNQSQLNHFKETLEQRLEELSRHIREEQRQAGEFPEGVNDAGDNAVRDLYSDTDLTLGSRYTEEIYATDAALQRIARGEYGKCAECGGEVSLKRLEAEPTATTCTACAARLETPPPPNL